MLSEAASGPQLLGVFGGMLGLPRRRGRCWPGSLLSANQRPSDCHPGLPRPPTHPRGGGGAGPATRRWAEGRQESFPEEASLLGGSPGEPPATAHPPAPTSGALTAASSKLDSLQAGGPPSPVPPCSPAPHPMPLLSPPSPGALHRFPCLPLLPLQDPCCSLQSPRPPSERDLRRDPQEGLCRIAFNQHLFFAKRVHLGWGRGLQLFTVGICAQGCVHLLHVVDEERPVPHGLGDEAHPRGLAIGSRRPRWPPKVGGQGEGGTKSL